jgi:hypothetical protein
LCEISPDQNLKTSKVLGVAESLPDSARDSFDGVYKAIDIYLEASIANPHFLFLFCFFLIHDGQIIDGSG